MEYGCYKQSSSFINSTKSTIMERKYVKLPLSSIVIREYSLILALSYLFAQHQAKLSIVMGVVIFWGIYRMVKAIISDKGYSTCHKVISTCIIVIALALIIYGLFFNIQNEQVNHLITTIGLCVTCGCFLATGIIIQLLRKRIEAANNSEDVLQSFSDATHILILYIVILVTL